MNHHEVASDTSSEISIKNVIETLDIPQLMTKDGVRSCRFCNLTFQSFNELVEHVQGHRPHSADYHENEYVCKVCNKVLSSASSLDRHALTHSGERPYKCEHCMMSFATNCNMNRHLRSAHRGPSPNSYTDFEDGSNDSEGSTKRNHIEEYNNNEITKPMALNCSKKRKTLDYDNDNEEVQQKCKISRSDDSEENHTDNSNEDVYICSICRKNFSSKALMEAHIDKQHSKVTCEICKHICNDGYDLRKHCFLAHGVQNQDITASSDEAIRGFQDLTFIDFSMRKFQTIARTECEKRRHRPPSREFPKYQCSKCNRGFPCQSALDAHENDCGMPSYESRPMEEDLSNTTEFFDGLNLQNKAALAEAKEGKDLADISSILSMTSGSIFQNLARSDASTPDICQKTNGQNPGSSSSSGTPSSDHHDEEPQDDFVLEFRKMKLKGEFPCKLCTAIFPNLRALKGHNRAHMNVAPGEPYPCNMCPYTSTDKATLLKHLRSHNGDRPFECTECKFAFTTKANCERHVRNRHGISLKKDVQKYIIQRPIEESSNIDLEKESSNNGKKTYYPIERTSESLRPVPQLHLQQQQPHYPLALDTKPITKVQNDSMLNSSKKYIPSALYNLPMMSHFENNNFFLRRPFNAPIELAVYRCTEELDQPQNLCVKSEESTNDEDRVSPFSQVSASLVSEAKPQAHQRNEASPSNISRDDGANEDGPLDLSMDVLDLSKKSPDKGKGANSSPEANNNNDIKTDGQYLSVDQILLTQALMRARQVGSTTSPLQAYYANAEMLCRKFSGYRASDMIPPYLLNQHFLNSEYAIKDRLQKELVRGLQTSGGSLVQPTIGTPAFPQSTPIPIGPLAVGVTPEHNNYQQPSTSQNSNSVSPVQEKLNNTTPSSTNSVRMVLKNGHLMPKQKQRRYRTERPHVCPICSAKFTLRSNMDRHIKQQHPTSWKKRPRNARSNRGRPPSSPKKITIRLRRPEMQSVPQSYSEYYPEVRRTTDENGKHAISNQVKYAILAQQQKNGKLDQNDSDEELIIDEEQNDRESCESPQNSESATSMLRETLEGNDHADKDMSMEAYDLSKTKAPQTSEENAQRNTFGDGFDAFGNPLPSTSGTQVFTSTTSTISKDIKTEKSSTEQKEENESTVVDFASVSEILDNASQQYQQFQPQYMSEEEGLIASGSDGNISGSDDKSLPDSVNSVSSNQSNQSNKKKQKKKKIMKKKSAYSTAPNRVSCPYCSRQFPWTSSLRRHILTHTGQKPFRCKYCGLLFTTKSNCDRHLSRKHPEEIVPTTENQESTTNTNGNNNGNNNNNPAIANNNSAFAMRNVPERPYKCNICPSSTFSTVGNLKKHQQSKHPQEKSRSITPSSDQQNSPPDNSAKQNDQSGYESSSTGSENLESTNHTNARVSPTSRRKVRSPTGNMRSRRSPRSPRSSPNPSDTPFKCHLCDSGFAVREDCLQHLKIYHRRQFDELMAKKAFGDEERPQRSASDCEEKRGKCPDYANRKVKCAFCMRPFWSAEDLRRHMRTHTGERPFACDVCLRRFTLKHSMLRHRKKHSAKSVERARNRRSTSEEEEQIGSNQRPVIAPRSHQQLSNLYETAGPSRMQDRVSLPIVVPVATGDAAPSSLVGFNRYEQLSNLSGRMENVNVDNSIDTTETTDNNDNDLISNLLGIRDKSIIDKVLQASADDAAKLLGVKENQE